MNGTKFKELRTLLGMTQQEVADMVDINQGYVSLFENGNAVPAYELSRLDNFIAAVRKAVEQYDQQQEAT